MVALVELSLLVMVRLRLLLFCLSIACYARRVQKADDRIWELENLQYETRNHRVQHPESGLRLTKILLDPDLQQQIVKTIEGNMSAKHDTEDSFLSGGLANLFLSLRSISARAASAQADVRMIKSPGSMLGKKAVTKSMERSPVLMGLAAKVGSKGQGSKVFKEGFARSRFNSTDDDAAFGSLVNILGEDDAMKVVEEQPSLLKRPYAYIKETWEALVDILGETEAKRAVMQTPIVLQMSEDFFSNDTLTAKEMREDPDFVEADLPGLMKPDPGELDPFGETMFDPDSTDPDINALDTATLSESDKKFIDEHGIDINEKIPEDQLQLFESEKKKFLRMLDNSSSNLSKLLKAQADDFLQTLDRYSDADDNPDEIEIGVDLNPQKIAHGSQVEDFLQDIAGRKIPKSFLDRFEQDDPLDTSPRTWKALVDILGENDARKAVKKRPLIMGLPEEAFTSLEKSEVEYFLESLPVDNEESADLAGPAWEQLVDILGPLFAMKVAKNAPSVLAAPSETVRGTWTALVDMLGEVDARKAVRQNPFVLQAPAEFIRDEEKSSLQEILLSSEGIPDIPEMMMPVEPPKPKSYEDVELSGEAWEALVDIMGEASAFVAVERNPAVLKVRPDIIRGAWGMAVEGMGPRGAYKMASMLPEIIAGMAVDVTAIWGNITDEHSEEQATEALQELVEKGIEYPRAKKTKADFPWLD